MPLLWLVTCLAGLLCQCSSSDIGAACPQLLSGAQVLTPSEDPTVTLSQNVVAMGPEYEPCASLVCIAAQGRSGYCSNTCIDDSGCPAGFACQIVQTLGAFAGNKFCVWKRCTTRADCGSSKDFCCIQVAASGDNPTFSQCAFSTDGQCP